MSVTEEWRTHGRARLSFANEADLDEFADGLARYERGEMSATEWRVFRLARGTYGQRQLEDAQMIRVKIPQGIVSASQLRSLADAARLWSRGFGHITTRQNIQLHFVRLHDVEPVMRHLADAGLTTREACGNAVRNVTTCVMAGVSPTEVFDVTPYAEALTRYFLRHPLSAVLPRKFKIAFEGCATDHIFAAINDIGWRARIVDGRRGFRVFVGGGTSTMATSARVLTDFLPAERMLALAEAIVRVFHARGDYQHKARNRMKFLIKAMGWEGFRDEVIKTQALVDAERLDIALPFDPDRPPVEDAPLPDRRRAPSALAITRLLANEDVRGPGIRPEVAPRLPDVSAAGFARWATTNITPQRQPGYVVATATVPLGDLSADQLIVIARLAEAFSDGTVRLTLSQNVVFRWVAEDQVARLHEALAAAGLGTGGADSAADVTSCPGAETCKLAVTQSRGLGQAIGLHLRTLPALSDGATAFSVKVSGCPNGCGQHHVAAVGFQGSLRKIDGRAAPQYFVTVGGGMRDDGAAFGSLIAKVPARRAPLALERLTALFVRDRLDDETATSFFARQDRSSLKALLADLEEVLPGAASPEDFVDFAETGPFRPDMQEGECAV